MKGISKAFFFTSVAVLTFCQANVAQTKEVTYSDVLRMEQTAMTLLRATPHRSTWRSWVFPERGKEASYKTVSTNEFEATGRMRSVQENDTPGSFKRMEVILIGGMHYRKVDDNPWHVSPTMPPPTPPADPTPTVISRPRFEQKVRLIETLNDKDGMVSVYETVSKSTREVNGKEISQINTNRFWFRYDGKLLRKDMELETVGELRILKNSRVYEYVAIKIEEPVVK